MIGFEWVETEVKLQLQKEQEEEEQYKQFVRARTAAIEKKEKEEKEKERQVTGLLVEGYNTDVISYILDMPLAKVARIEDRSREKLEFLLTGQLPKEPASLRYTTEFQLHEKKGKRNNHLYIETFITKWS